MECCCGRQGKSICVCRTRLYQVVAKTMDTLCARLCVQGNIRSLHSTEFPLNLFLLRIFPRKIVNLFFISELLFSSVCAQPLVNVKYLRFYLQKYTLFFRRLLYSESHKFIWYIYPRSSTGNWSKSKNMIKMQKRKNTHTHTNCWENEIIASTQHVCVENVDDMTYPNRASINIKWATFKNSFSSLSQSSPLRGFRFGMLGAPTIKCR